MNDFERRLLDVTQSHAFIQQVKRQGQNIVAMDFFSYNAAIENVATGATGQATVQVQSDSDFVMTYMSAQVISAGAVVGNPLLTVQVTDTGTGKTFFSSEVFMSLAFGSGGFPFLLPAPRVIAPNTNLLVNLTNTSAATYTTYFSFFGVRVYY